MSIEQAIVAWLTERGLWEHEATAILEAVKVVHEKTGIRWRSAADGYPPTVLSVLLLTAGAEAVKWIDENAPKHWARAVFA